MFLVNFLIAVASDLPRALDHRPDDDDMVALCFSMVTSITFWIPTLYLFYWAFGRKVLKVVGWMATVWMVCVQLYRLGVLFNMRYVETTDIVIGIVVALIGFLGVAAVVRNLIVMKACNVSDRVQTEKPPRPPKVLKVKYVCPSCKKTIKASVTAAPDGITNCPSCGSEIGMTVLATCAKEPLTAQLARVIFYIMGILAIISGVGQFLTGRFSSDFAVLTGELVAIIGFPVLLFSMAGGIKKGRMWVRILLVVLSMLTGVWLVMSKCNPIAITFGCITIVPMIFVFLPRCNNWFSLKRMCRKA